MVTHVPCPVHSTCLRSCEKRAVEELLLQALNRGKDIDCLMKPSSNLKQIILSIYLIIFFIFFVNNLIFNNYFIFFIISFIFFFIINIIVNLFLESKSDKKINLVKNILKLGLANLVGLLILRKFFQNPTS